MATYIEQRDDYRIVEDDEGYGNALVLRKAWSSQYLNLIKRYKIRIVRLNEHVGWHGSDLSFLSEIPNLQGVDILSDKVVDVSPVFQLQKLKTLSLFCKATMAGDFAALEQLQSVGLGWRRVFESIFDRNTLLSINILHFPNTDLKCWAFNPKLEKLGLESRKLEELRGIERFPNIRRLHLYRCPSLQSLEALGSSIFIQELRISHCTKIRDWKPVSSLSNLKVLEIEDCGNIASVIPFAKCLKLERLQIAGKTTIVNGDLSSLTELPNLKTVLLAQKKHYSHSDEELERLAIARNG